MLTASVASVWSTLPTGPPPQISTCWVWAGGSRTLADWLRESGASRSGTGLVGTGFWVRSRMQGWTSKGSSMRPPEKNTRPSANRNRWAYSGRPGKPAAKCWACQVLVAAE